MSVGIGSVNDTLKDLRQVLVNTSISASETGVPGATRIIQGDQFAGSNILVDVVAWGTPGQVVKAQVWVTDARIGLAGAWIKYEEVNIPVEEEPDELEPLVGRSFFSQVNGQVSGITFSSIPAGATVEYCTACLVNRNGLGAL